MTITRDFKLHLNDGSSSPLMIRANQYDSGEIWRFTLFDEDGVKYIPSSAIILGTTMSGTLVTRDATIKDDKVIVEESRSMTQSSGLNLFELVIDGGSHGTSNFIVAVEPRPNKVFLSENDLQTMENAIEAGASVGGIRTQVEANTNAIESERTARQNGDSALHSEIESVRSAVGSPLVASTAAEMANTNKVYVYTGSETGYTAGDWYYYNGSAWVDGGVYNSVAFNTDKTLSVEGSAADAKKTGDAVSDLKSAINIITDKAFDRTNLYNHHYVIDGYNIQNGVITSNADWSYLNIKIDVSDEETISIRNFSRKNGQCSCSFYNASGIFISRLGVTSLISNNNYSVKYTVPENSAYCMFAISRNSNLSKTDSLMISYGDVPEKYYYENQINGEWLWQDERLKTVELQNSLIALEKGSSLRFCLIGDLHCGECGGLYNPLDPSEEGTEWDSQGTYAGATLDERMQLLVDTINAENAKKPFDFILSTGDIGLEHGTSTQAEFNNPAYLEKFCKEYMPQLPCPLYAAPGNHDCFTEADWQKCIGLPRQYSFETDDFYFIVLDVFSNITMGCNGASPTGIGYDHIDFDYLEAEYTKARNKKVIIVAHTISNNASSELGYEDQVKMQAFVRSHNNVILTITGHSHAYVFKTWWGIPTINSNHFCYPTKQWSAGYNEHSYLWSINIVEINSDGTALQTYYVQPAHNYTGMGLNYPYTVGPVHDIIAIDKNYHADFYAHKADKRNIELSKQIYDLINRISALEK